MRAPGRLIPTESFGISIAVGALVPLLMILGACGFPERLFTGVILFSPFVCGFSGSIVFGGTGRPGVGHTVPIGLLAYLIYSFLLVAVVHRLPFAAERDLGIALYMNFFPPVFFAAVIISVVGGIFGWLAALAIRR